MIITTKISKKRVDSTTALNKMKRVAWMIMHAVQGDIDNGMKKKKSKMLVSIAGKDSVVNVFLKISTLLCKIVTIESKIQLDPALDEPELVTQKEKEIDVGILERFLSKIKRQKDHE